MSKFFSIKSILYNRTTTIIWFLFSSYYWQYYHVACHISFWNFVCQGFTIAPSFWNDFPIMDHAGIGITVMMRMMRLVTFLLRKKSKTLPVGARRSIPKKGRPERNPFWRISLTWNIILSVWLELWFNLVWLEL